MRDVAAAQRYYRDKFGFQIEWFNEAGRIGAVSHGDCAIFLREIDGDISPATFWVFAEDVDATHDALVLGRADIVEPVEDKPWGLRQFTVRDLNGHLYHFHHDL